jgi:hypothetical protein
VIGQGVEDLGAGKDMETNKKDVVGEQHETSELISKSSSSKGFISKITYGGHSSVLGTLGTETAIIRLQSWLTDVFDMRMLHNELMHSNGGDPECSTGDKHSYNSWNPA